MNTSQKLATIHHLSLTASNSYHQSIYCASTKVESKSMVVGWGHIFAIDELDLR